MPEVKEYFYSGPLANPIQRYVKEKRALGYNFNTSAKKLAYFDRFTMEHPCEQNVLSKELAETYAGAKDGESPHTQQERICSMRNLAKYMVHNGYKAYVLPAEFDVGYQYDAYIPYIYSHDEIVRLFEQADKLPSHICSPYRAQIAPLLFRMLYSCGLRSSEALNLKVKDVDTELGIITILNAKYDKDRLVPMPWSLNERSREYMQNVHPQCLPEEPFFPNANRQHFSERGIYDSFRIILSKAGISHGGKGNGPRVHDFRHTFAVHCLKRWVLQGEDITGKLMFLSSYLGHRKISATAGYLRLTLDLFPQITHSLEHAYPDLIPTLEVIPNESN